MVQLYDMHSAWYFWYTFPAWKVMKTSRCFIVIALFFHVADEYSWNIFYELMLKKAIVSLQQLEHVFH